MVTDDIVDAGVIGAMVVCGLIPLIVLARLVLTGWIKVAFGVLGLLIGALTAAFYAAVTPTGIDPLRALVTGQIFLSPATAGAIAGIVLGFVIRKRRERQFEK